jgi:hypothetical protein
MISITHRDPSRPFSLLRAFLIFSLLFLSKIGPLAAFGAEFEVEGTLESKNFIGTREVQTANFGFQSGIPTG